MTDGGTTGLDSNTPPHTSRAEFIDYDRRFQTAALEALIGLLPSSRVESIEAFSLGGRLEVTAKGQEFDRQRGQEVGADLYMTKPFDPDALIAKARSVLGLSAPGA